MFSNTGLGWEEGSERLRSWERQVEKERKILRKRGRKKERRICKKIGWKEETETADGLDCKKDGEKRNM